MFYYEGDDLIVYNLRPRKVWVIVHKDRPNIPAFPYSWKSQAAARTHILHHARPGIAGEYLLVSGIETRTVRTGPLPPRTKVVDQYYRHDGKGQLYDPSLMTSRYTKKG